MLCPITITVSLVPTSRDDFNEIDSRVFIVASYGFLAVEHSAPVMANSRPNVIVIYTDDQGFGDASCLNGCQARTLTWTGLRWRE